MPTPIPFPTHIDSSMRSSFASCPRKFFFQYLLRKQPSADSVHLVFGGAMARGLEVARRAIWRDGLPLRESIDLGCEAIIKFWMKTSVNPEPEGSPKSLKNCIKALELYFGFFQPYEDYIRPMPFGQDGSDVAVEFTFAVPLHAAQGFPLHPETGLPILYTGRFDMLGQTSSGLRMIVDDKTCSQLGLNFSKSMKMRSQFTGYTWACDQFGLSTGGILIRATCIQKTQITFAEITEMRPDHMVAQWLDQLRKDTHAMVGMWGAQVRSDAITFDSNLDDSCGSYGGCPYLDACLSPLPRKVVEDFFQDNLWDPLAKHED